MSAHRFSAIFPRLLTRHEQAQGKAAPEYAFSIEEVGAAEAPPTLKVIFGPAEDGDEVTLLGYRGRLYAEFDGQSYWSHGPRPEHGADAEQVRVLLKTDLTSFNNSLRSALSPGKPQYRLRQGPIVGDNPTAEVAEKAARFLFIDGRLHRMVEEPVWSVAFHDNADAASFCRAEVRVHINPSIHPASDCPINRLDVAQALVQVRVGRHRNCRAGEPLGGVEILDPGFAPAYDSFVAMTRAYGDDVARKIEPMLPELDRDCVEAFADIATGYATVETDGRMAADRFCGGMVRFYDRLTEDRRRVPADLRNWMREKVSFIRDRIVVEREIQAAAVPRPPGP
jgi:hypothetical protein